MSSPKDVVIDIVELDDTSRVRASESAVHASGKPSWADAEQHARYEPFRRQGAYTELSGGHGEDDEDQQKGLTRLQTFIYNLTKSTPLRWLFMYYLPPVLIILIGVAITATIAKGWLTLEGIRGIGIFIWLEVIWAIFWGSWGLAFVLPFVFQSFAGFFTSAAKDYTDILKAIIWPMTAFCFAILSREATRLLCRFNLFHPNRCDGTFVMGIRRFLLATVACTGLFFVQKVLIHLLTVNYHKRQFKIRVEESKIKTRILAIMYEASVRLYPAFCARFIAEDLKIHRSKTVRVAAFRHLQQSRFGKRLNRSSAVDAISEAKARIHGKEVLNIDSPRSVVMKALENEQASAALARRLWFSFSTESDTITEDDIARILGPGQEEHALDIFLALDQDKNGDVSLDEMVALLTQFSKDRKHITRSMHDIGQAIKSLDRILELFLLFVCIIIYSK